MAAASAQPFSHSVLLYNPCRVSCGSSPSTNDPDLSQLDRQLDLCINCHRWPTAALPSVRWPLCGALWCIEHIDCPIQSPIVEGKSRASPTDPPSTLHHVHFTQIHSHPPFPPFHRAAYSIRVQGRHSESYIADRLLSERISQLFPSHTFSRET